MVISFCEEGRRTITGVEVICKHGVPSLSGMYEGLKQAELGVWRTTLSTHYYSEIDQCIQLLPREEFLRHMDARSMKYPKCGHTLP